MRSGHSRCSEISARSIMTDRRLTPLQTYPRIAVLQFINKIFKPAINLAVPKVDVFHASNQIHAMPRGCETHGHHLRHDLPADAAVSHSRERPS